MYHLRTVVLSFSASSALRSQLLANPSHDHSVVGSTCPRLRKDPIDVVCVRTLVPQNLMKCLHPQNPKVQLGTASVRLHSWRN